MRHRRPKRNALLGSIVLLVAGFGIYMAFAKHLPFTGHGYELHATFDNAATLRPGSPVRIAGVNVGTVLDVAPKGNDAEVTFTVSSEGQPVHSDASIEIRPRLFLEGNFFLDLHPGSPSAPELPAGGTIPVTQTSTAVQLDEVLTALQSNSRRDLQRLLSGYGQTLTYQPTPAADATQVPLVKGKTAAQAINDSFRFGGRAERGTAITSEALLGRHPNDLSGLIRAQRDVFSKLAGSEAQLQDLITNFNVTTGALASRSASLEASIHQLAPTLAEAKPSLRDLSAALPPFRALALALRPGVAQLPGTIRAAGPWLHQARALLQNKELGGLARLLAHTTPGLASTAKTSQRLFPQITLLSRCASGILAPTANTVINDPFSTGQPSFHEALFNTVNLAGQSQAFDGNGPYLRLFTGGGPTLVKAPNPDGANAPHLNTEVFGNTTEAPTGIQPALPASGPPPFRTDVPCYQNPAPDLNGPAATPGPPDLTPAP